MDHIAVLLDDPVPAVQAEALRSLTKCGQEGRFLMHLHALAEPEVRLIRPSCVVWG